MFFQESSIAHLLLQPSMRQQKLFLSQKGAIFYSHKNSQLKMSQEKSVTQVEVARPNWALIRPSSSAHMFAVRSNYMVWKRLRAHFCLDNGLELAWSEATLVWDGLIRGHFGLGRSDQRQFQAHTSLIRGRFERTLVLPETKSSEFFFKFFLFSFTDICCLW